VIRLELDKARIAEFCRKWHISELSVFGSALRDDFRPDSDVDVMVVLGPDAHVGLIGFCQMQIELSEMLGREVDLVTKSGLKPRIRENVIAEAELLYAA
jgi:uncharacterized protein